MKEVPKEVPKEVSTVATAAAKSWLELTQSEIAALTTATACMYGKKIKK